MSSSNHNAFSIRSVLEKDKLNGSNFLNWFRNLRIVLRQEDKDYVLEKVLPERPRSNASLADKTAYDKHVIDIKDVNCLMLIAMTPELQMQYENSSSPIETIASLKSLFQEQARIERYKTVKSLIDCKMAKDASVSPHVIKMMGYIDNLGRLDYPINNELANDIILQSLPPSFDNFVMNFNMNNVPKTTAELHGMLKTAEPNIRKATPNVLMVQKGKGFNKPSWDKGKGKAVQVEKRTSPSPSTSPRLSLLMCANFARRLDIGKETATS